MKNACGIIEVLNTLQLKLTKWLWLWPFRLVFRRVELVVLPTEGKTDVIVYAAKYTGRIAQCTLFGTIIVDELTFDSPRYLIRVVTHELTLMRQWYGYLAFPLVMIFGLVAFPMLMGTLSLLILSLFLGPQVLVQALYLLALTSLLVVVPCGYSWFIEYKAEAKTFRKLGIDTVLAIDRDFAPRQKVPVLWHIVGIMTHPSGKAH